MQTQFPILFQDEHYVVIDKPEGFHVHKPEDRRIKVPRDRIIVWRLREQLGIHVNPVHRLDAATSGCMIWATNKEAASKLSLQFSQDRSVKKVYWALVRGWMKAEWKIETDLELDSTGVPVNAATFGKSLSYLEIPQPVGKRYPTARYTWVEVEPQTGRYRQIRRHLHRVAHPIIGDSDYGDGFHNRFFREKMEIPGLFLRATALRFRHPMTEKEVEILSPSHAKWERLKSLAIEFAPEDLQTKILGPKT